MTTWWALAVAFTAGFATSWARERRDWLGWWVRFIWHKSLGHHR